MSVIGKGVSFIFAAIAVVMALRTAVVPAAGAEAPCSQLQYTGDKVALVVGTDDYSIYSHDKIPNLHNAANDARTMADLLSKQGFVVRCLLNPTQLAFRDEKNRLVLYLQQRKQEDSQAADSGRAVIYIAGHGYRDPAGGQDYLLLRFEQDEQRYSNVVDLMTLTGRVAQGRWSVQALTQAFNTAIQGVLFIFDVCRSPVEIPAASGVPVRAAQIEQMRPELMKGSQIVAYSTQGGGFAADSIPDSAERNGLYASVLSNFIGLPISTLGHALDLTGTVVKANNDDQLPIYSVSAGTFFLANPWVNDELSETCDLVDTEIWNAAGKRCSQLRDRDCILKDICPVVRPHLIGTVAPQAKACLARHKEKWLRNDLVGICSVPASGTPVIQHGDAGSPRPASAAVFAGIGDAYNVVTVGSSDISSADLTTLTLSGWAAKAGSAGFASKKDKPVNVDFDPVSLDRTLAGFNRKKDKLVYSTMQRDNLMIKSVDSGPPPLSFPSPFNIDLTGQKITLYNLPAANSGKIATFNGDTSTAEIDCGTMPCLNDWIGVRVKEGNTTFRGWTSADALKSLAKPEFSVNVEYDGKRIAPRAASVEAIRRAVRPADAKQQAGRVHIVAMRAATDATSSLFAAARLSYLERMLVDFGLNPDHVDQTVFDVPDGSTLPAVIINVGPASSKYPAYLWPSQTAPDVK